MAKIISVLILSLFISLPANLALAQNKKINVVPVVQTTVNENGFEILVYSRVYKEILEIDNQQVESGYNFNYSIVNIKNVDIHISWELLDIYASMDLKKSPQIFVVPANSTRSWSFASDNLPSVIETSLSLFADVDHLGHLMIHPPPYPPMYSLALGQVFKKNIVSHVPKEFHELLMKQKKISK